MEREFLKSLAETRAIEAKLTAEMKAAQRSDLSDPGTRKGALALQEQVQKLAEQGGHLRAQLASDRARFSALHRGWKVCQYITTEISCVQQSACVNVRLACAGCLHVVCA